jgi:phospholipase/carboxylesterase
VTDLSHVHLYEPGSGRDRPPLLLLHGTGGDEHQLVPFARSAAPGSPFVAVRGRVSENGKLRYFRRDAEGHLDEDDVRRRAGELAGFIAEARRASGLAAPIALGQSNGANIAAALLQLHADMLAGAVLLRAVAPLSDPRAADLAGKPVLILSGATDPIAPPDWVDRLEAQLQAAGAAVAHERLPAGHALGPADVERTRDWLARL